MKLLIFMMIVGLFALVTGFLTSRLGTVASGGTLLGVGLGYAAGYGSALMDAFVERLRRDALK